MADILTFVISVLIGGICTVLYLVLSRRGGNPKPRDVKLETIFTLFLRSGGLVGGLSLMIFTFWEDITKYLLVSKLHIFLGGVAVLYISLKGIISDIQEPKDLA